MPAIDAHHMRARLVSDLGTRLGARLIGAFLESTAEEKVAMHVDVGFLTSVTAPMMVDETKVAESFYVTPDMMVLTEAAAKAMPNIGPARGELPAEAGFLYLPRPITHFDVRGRTMNTHALQWFVGRGGLCVFFWADRDDPDDEVNAEIRENHFRQEHNRREPWEAFPKLQMQHLFRLRFEEELHLFPDTSNLHRWREMLGVTFAPDYEDTDAESQVSMGWHVDSGTEENRVHANRLLVINPPVPKPDAAVRFLVAFFRLCGQSITTSSREPVDRAARRRARGLPNNDAVTVINLRHSVQGEKPDHESQVEWSHRWLRRGHWRRQWYGPKDGHRYQSPVWISESICGPEDKPLIVRDHVTSLSR